MRQKRFINQASLVVKAKWSIRLRQRDKNPSHFFVNTLFLCAILIVQKLMAAYVECEQGLMR